MLDLTIQDVEAFVGKLNDGREALGLPRLDRIDFDTCEPDSGLSCLSATHLYVRDQGGGTRVRWVDTDWARAPQPEAEALAEAFGVKPKASGADSFYVGTYRVRIPDEILRVTNVFGSCEDGSTTAVKRLEELRDLFVEAGYVEG